MTKKREYLLTASPPQDVGRHYYVFTPTYFRGDIPAELVGEHYDYLIVSWWDLIERRRRLRETEQLSLPGTMEHIARFPDTATDETESLPLPDDMRDPLFKLSSLMQNGPVVDVFRIR
jgi:hypothetical protein